MLNQLLPLLNIKPSEKGLVMRLLLIQFLLGVAVAFLNTGSLTLFLYKSDIKALPQVFILSAVLLIIFNRVYAHFEEKLSSADLLKWVILFSAGSLLVLWVALLALNNAAMAFLLAAWNVLVYMLVGYAFWGIAAVLFDVRESKRLFSIVGAGDIPAKLLGYASVSLLAPYIGIVNLLWISIIAFGASLFFLSGIQKAKPLPADGAHHNHKAVQHFQHSVAGLIERLFHKRLIFAIALLALLSSVVFSFADYTFLAEIKSKYKEEQQLATFIAVFFGAGRVAAILIKFLLSSRVINRLGLTNTLAITPLLLLIINAFAVFYIESSEAQLYLFGAMVLLMEVLRSTIQEPVFFILFQPLNAHDRLKGHLIAKGYTLPAALLGVGAFLLLYQQNESISILMVSKILMGFLMLWLINVFFIRTEYHRTLVASLKKGYFTGEELFLDNEGVKRMLLDKAKSTKPQEVIHALNLLERSKYSDMNQLLLMHMQVNDTAAVRRYCIDRVVANNISEGLPIIKQQLERDNSLQKDLIKAWFYLQGEDVAVWQSAFANLESDNQKAAMTGLLLKKEATATSFVKEQLMQLGMAKDPAQNKLVLDVINEVKGGDFKEVLHVLLQHPQPEIYNYAIETVGKVKELSLFEAVYEKTIAYKAYYAFQKALVNYGEVAFSAPYVPDHLGHEAVCKHAIKAAAKVKGPKAEAFLINLFEQHLKYQYLIIDVLWYKKAGFENGNAILEGWVAHNLKALAVKTLYYEAAGEKQNLQLLQEALASEIRQDVEIVLKAFALLYNREPINRFIELYKLENRSKLANAMELLELTIPKKYFHLLSEYVELAKDIKANQVAPKGYKKQVPELLWSVVTNTGAEFNEWSRSVALYLMPQGKERSITKALLAEVGDGDVLMQETGSYVLSITNA